MQYLADLSGRTVVADEGQMMMMIWGAERASFPWESDDTQRSHDARDGAPDFISLPARDIGGVSGWRVRL